MFPLERQLYETLKGTPSAIAPAVHAMLRALRPERHLLYHDLYNFDVDDYADAGECTLTERADLPAVWRTWRDEQGKFARCTDQGWFDLTWRGRSFELIVLQYGENDTPSRRYWLLADDEAIARDFVREVIAWNEAIEGEVLVYENSSWKANHELFDSISAASFDQLILLPELQQQLRDDVKRFFERRDFYEANHIPWKRGLLLVGPPGNGKTQSLKALLKETGKPVLYVKTMKGRNSSEVDGLRRVFERARRNSPCVLVLEDLDSHVDDSNRSVFLNELDGFARNHGLLTIATTNHPDKLDRSILERPSRFDRKFHFPLPAIAERRRYLQRWNETAADALKLSEAGIAILSEETKGFSFAYLKELMLSSTMAWVDQGVDGSMDEIAARTLQLLKKDLDSTTAVLGRLPENHKRVGIRVDA